MISIAIQKPHQLATRSFLPIGLFLSTPLLTHVQPATIIGPRDWANSNYPISTVNIYIPHNETAHLIIRSWPIHDSDTYTSERRAAKWTVRTASRFEKIFRIVQ